ncbi:MAG: DinB family protein, partial [Myxococcota bacterium]|nr:DinB family protein [Myxococcota bacterium]
MNFELESGLASRYQQTRDATVSLVSSLSPEDCSAQSMEDASPAKWHLAHTTWFFETFVLEAADPEYVPFDSSYRFLFNSYYNTVGEQYPRPRRGLLTRPDLATVRDYRDSVDEALARRLASGRLPEALLDIVELGINHEEQHQELLLTDILHLLSLNPLRPAYRDDLEAPGHGSVPPFSWHRGADGIQSIGHRGAGF